MKRLFLMLVWIGICLVMGCSSQKEGDDIDTTTIAAQGDFVYFISKQGNLCCFSLQEGKLQTISQKSGSIYQTPWDVLFVHGEAVERLRDGKLELWLTLPEGNAFASATENGCYSVKQPKGSDSAEIYYTTETESRQVTVLKYEKEPLFELRIYAAGDGFYYEDAKGLHYWQGEEDLIIETSYQSICQGRKGIAYMKGTEEVVSADPDSENFSEDGVCSLYYCTAGGIEAISGHLAAEGLLYQDGYFVTVGQKIYRISEEAPQLEPVEVVMEHHYTSSARCMSEQGLISRIAWEDRFCFQSSEGELVFDFSE